MIRGKDIANTVRVTRTGQDPRTLFPAEHFLKQCRGPGRGVLANLLFFFSEHVEETVQGFFDNVFVEIELTSEGAAHRRVPDDPVVLLDNGRLSHGPVPDRALGGAEV